MTHSRITIIFVSIMDLPFFARDTHGADWFDVSAMTGRGRDMVYPIRKIMSSQEIRLADFVDLSLTCPIVKTPTGKARRGQIRAPARFYCNNLLDSSQKF